MEIASTPLSGWPHAARGARIWLTIAISGGLALLAGCGLAANPQPPTLWLPEPPKNLTAERIGDEVQLHWTMPKNTTDKVALKGPQRAHFCWETEVRGAAGKAAFNAKQCQAAGDGAFPPGKPAEATVNLPAELTSGAPRPAAFYVELQNHAGKMAGPSNAAWVAAGATPPAVSGLRLETQPQGVVLHWDASAPEPQLVMRLHRTLVPQASASKPDESKGAPPPEVQVLEVDLEKADPGGAIDRDAQLDHEWRYQAERVLRVDAGGHDLEIAGRSSPALSIDAKDVFPPAVPGGLTAVADEQGHAIDLSWTPDTDADLAGYVVYRRDVTSGSPMERISPRTPLVPASFADTSVANGHQYAYAVSAIDQDGNESARSGEVTEQLPQ